MAEGRFDVVADGRPLDFDDYFSTPAELRLAYSVLKSAGCVPEEVELLKEVDRLRRAVDAAPDEASRAPLRKALTDAQLRLDLALERARRNRVR
jgi:hypothetical protein